MLLKLSFWEVGVLCFCPGPSSPYSLTGRAGLRRRSPPVSGSAPSAAQVGYPRQCTVRSPPNADCRTPRGQEAQNREATGAHGSPHPSPRSRPPSAARAALGASAAPRSVRRAAPRRAGSDTAPRGARPPLPPRRLVPRRSRPLPAAVSVSHCPSPPALRPSSLAPEYTHLPEPGSRSLLPLPRPGLPARPEGSGPGRGRLAAASPPHPPDKMDTAEEGKWAACDARAPARARSGPGSVWLPGWREAGRLPGGRRAREDGR